MAEKVLAEKVVGGRLSKEKGTLETPLPAALEQSHSGKESEHLLDDGSETGQAAAMYGRSDLTSLARRCSPAWTRTRLPLYQGQHVARLYLVLEPQHLGRCLAHVHAGPF